MTTKPTIEANKAVGSVLTAAEWNTNDLQLANYVLEVLAGSNTDKIPGSALSTTLDLGGYVAFGTAIAAPGTGFPTIYNGSDAFTHLDNPFGSSGWKLAYDGTTAFEFDSSGAFKLLGQTRRFPSKGTSASFNAAYNTEVTTTITLEDATFTPVSAIANIKTPSAAALYVPRIISFGVGTVTVGVTSPVSPAPAGVTVEVWAV